MSHEIHPYGGLCPSDYAMMWDCGRAFFRREILQGHLRGFQNIQGNVVHSEICKNEVEFRFKLTRHSILKLDQF